MTGGLVFDCLCGATFREDKYPEPYRYDTYRDVVNAHRERCTLAAGLSDANVSRPVRPAADTDGTAYVPVSVANQTRVHNHPPYRPVCNERRLSDGRLRGACLEDDGTDRGAANQSSRSTRSDNTEGDTDGKQGGVHSGRARRVAAGPDRRGLHGGSGVLDRAGLDSRASGADLTGWRGGNRCRPATFGDRLVGGFFLFLAAPTVIGGWIHGFVSRALN